MEFLKDEEVVKLHVSLKVLSEVAVPRLFFFSVCLFVFCHLLALVFLIEIS